MPTTPRDIVIMLISLAASFHHGHCWKSFPSWRRSALNRFAASSSSDDNKGSSSLVPPTNGVKQKRPSKYYNENSKNLGKQALKSSSRTKLNTINAYDVNSSLESDSEYPSIMDSNREKRKMDMRSLHNGQYHSLTHELAASRTAFSRAIPPSTLEYDYNQDLDSIDPRDSLPQSPTQHTSNNNNNDPTLHIPLKPRSNAFMQKSTSQSNVVSGTLSKTNSNESIHDTNTTDIPFRNNNIYRKFDSTITRVVNDPVIDSSRRSAMKSSTGISDLPNRFREDQEQSSTTNKYQETLPESSSYPEISNESNRFNFLDVSSTTTMKEDPESYINSLKNRLRTLELDMFALNHDKVFNLNSRREISTLLFGVDNESINKDSLDALAGSNRVPANRIAGLLLSHRKLSRQLKVLEKDMEVTASGIQSGRLSPDTLDSIPLSSSPVGSSKMFVDKAFHSMATTTPSFFDDSDPLMLVDASAYIFRAYYSMPPIHRSDGMPVGAVLGFCNMVNNLILDAYIQGERPRLALVFDSKEGVSVRKTLYPQYKATRPPCPVDLIPQFDLIKQAADAYGIIKIEAPGHEADDVIATLATMARRDGCKVNIYSADKDLMQLITKDGRITMVDPMKLTIISYDAVIEKWGCPPEKLGEVLALAGDSSGMCPCLLNTQSIYLSSLYFVPTSL